VSLDGRHQLVSRHRRSYGPLDATFSASYPAYPTGVDSATNTSRYLDVPTQPLRMRGSSGTVTPRFKTRGGSGSGQQQEKPVARLKLLLVRFFCPLLYRYADWFDRLRRF